MQRGSAIYLAALGALACGPAALGGEPSSGVIAPVDVAGSTTEGTADHPARLHPPGPDAWSGGRGVAASRTARDRNGRVASLRYITWIYSRPDVRAKRLGYIRTGTSVALRQAGRFDGWGNCRGFFAVEPRGYVCDDDSATTDLGHPIVRAGRHSETADEDRPYRWALSLGAPMYNRIPTAAQHARVIARYSKQPRLDGWVKKYLGLARNEPIAATDPAPDFLAHGRSTPSPFTDAPGLVRKTIPLGSIVAYTRAFEHEGEIWLLSTDSTVVPASRARPYGALDFSGTGVLKDVELPLGWAVGGDAVMYRRSSTGTFAPRAEAWRKLQRFELTGRSEESEGETFWETRDEVGRDRAWVRDSEAAILTPPKRPGHVGDDERWILVRVSEGTLSAHVGDRTVLATLMSPGSGGVQPHGGDPVKLSTTPLGSYRVTWKDRSAGMSPDPGDPTTFWIQDVPWTMYFQAPFAIHASFWHDDLGKPKSGGCVNLAPPDARALFEWAEPSVPEDWQGVAHGGANGAGTRILVVP